MAVRRRQKKARTPIVRHGRCAYKGAMSGKRHKYVPRVVRRSGKRSKDRMMLFRRWPKWAVWIGIFLVVGLCVSAVCYFFIDPLSFRWEAASKESVSPKEFNVHGIDVSHYQGDIDWDVLRNADIRSAPVSFVFIKGTEGTTILDDCFNFNFYEARQSDIIRGVYHFFVPNADAKKQALYFLKQVHLEAGDLPPVLDVEKAGNLTKTQLQQAVLTWLQTVEGSCGVKPIIYTGYKFKMQYLSSSDFDDYPYWIAHYYVDELEYKGEWCFWQYTDSGRVAGVAGNVDCNIFNGTIQELKDITIKNDSE